MKNDRPKNVNTALFLFYASLAVGLVRSILEFPRIIQMAGPTASPGTIIFIQATVLIFLGGLVYGIGERKNWARWTFTILFVIGLPLYISPLIQTLEADLLAGIFAILQGVAQAVAIVLLFIPPANGWFKGQPSSLSSSELNHPL